VAERLVASLMLATALAVPVGAQERAADSLPPAPIQADSLLAGLTLSAVAQRELRDHLALNPTIVTGDVEIPRDSLFPSGLLVVNGTVRFQGRSPRTVMVVNGDFYLRPGAEIGGDAVVIEGQLYGTRLAMLAGERRVIRGDDVQVQRTGGAIEVRKEPEEPPFPIALRGIYGFVPEMYNRVDGLSARWGVRYVPPKEGPGALLLSAQVILRTSRDDVGWEAAAQRELLSRRLLLRAAWYNLTDTPERWHRGDVATSLAAFFLGEDNRFYFDRQGVELRARQEVRGPLAVELAFRSDTYRNVSTQDPFTILADDFLPNLPIEEGTMRSVLGGATWDARDDPEEPHRGWWAHLAGEAAGGIFESDHSFTSGMLDLRRYQPLGGHELDVRVVVGGRLGGTLPEQKRYHLGGAATLPGYEALQVRGDRAALLNLRYRIPIPRLQKIGLFRDGAWLTLLGDVGDAWDTHREDPSWLGSAGVGVGGRGAFNHIGVYVVVPTRQISEDQSDVSAFLHFGRFF
jgi:hypothetical protein